MADKNDSGFVDGLNRPLRASAEPQPIDLPRIAVSALSQANDNVLQIAEDNLFSRAAADVSAAASLLMIAELLEKTVSELRQLRGILCTRRPAL